MGWISQLWDSNESRQRLREETATLLPTSRNEVQTAIPAEEVTKVALRLKYQIETVVPCELEQDLITKANSPIITDAVVETARSAGGDEYKACVVYCLLICKKWFHRQANLELWDAGLHEARATSAEVIAKKIIESEEDVQYLMQDLLLTRFTIIGNGSESPPANAIERAVDLHALIVIGSSGYQKTVAYLWRGWMEQDEADPSRFVPYQHKANTSYYAHFDPDRVRVPQYQNALHIAISIVYLGLYTVAINTINREGDIDVIEGILYVFTLGFTLDEMAKVWKVGRYYLNFWNMFNSLLYILLAVSFILRMIALSHPHDSPGRVQFNTNSYNFLAFTAPMFWLRLMLFFDTIRFFGVMLVVVKVMMRESLIFFALLFIVVIGFFQAFIGLDEVDQELQDTAFVVKAMANAIMTSPEFDGFENFGHPFGTILYYLYTFVVMVVLVNVLVALYNSAYSDITEKADDEYMALVAQKCLQFVRAPDENVFIPPFNLIELIFLIPFEFFLSKPTYERINDIVMGIIYTPLLLISSALEVKEARRVKDNRRRGEVDEDRTEEWEEMDWRVEGEGGNGNGGDEDWMKKVEETKPDVKMEGTWKEVQELRKEIAELRELMMTKMAVGNDNANADGKT